jgi:probable F420-dependent oxidoreductase
MKLGTTYPQIELGGDPQSLRRFAEATEQLGYDHILLYDHVVGAVHEDRDPPLWGPYTEKDPFHDIFTAFAYLAALTQRIELISGILILPQRQTVLVAKQAAEVDLLTEGHFRLGVGIGWNAVEYEALGKRFSDRGARLEEQVALLRRLWTEPTVTFDGRYERVTGAGLAPMPRQRPIPIWLGGSSEPAYRRMGRLADGWFPQVQPGPKLDAARAILEESARAAGRDPASIGMEGRVNWRGDVADTVDRIEQWEKAGATHLSVNTMGAGLGTVDDHLRALAELAARRPPG